MGSNAQRISFDALGRSFELDLAPNTRLLAGLSDDARARLTNIDILAGNLDGNPDSWVRITRIASDYYGLIWDGQELYVVEPDHVTAQFSLMPLTAKGATRIYRWSDTSRQFSDIVLTRDTKNPGSPTKAYTSMIKELRAMPMMAVPTARLNIGVISDAGFTAGQFPNAESALIARINNVDGIFTDQVGILISIVETVIFDQNTDPFTTSDPSDLLDELAALKGTTPALRNTGLTHMFTGRDLNGDSIGIAFLNVLCEQSSGVSLTQGNISINVESLIAAHEFGHNFGAPHDAEAGSACSATPPDFLMAPQQNNSSIFSQCSLDQMQPEIAAANCLQPVGPPDIGTTLSPATLNGFLRDLGQMEVTLDNLGGGPAFDVLLELVIDPSVDVVLATGADGSCALSAGSAICRVDQINAGTQRIITLDLLANAVGSFAATITVDAAGDSDLNNNDAAFDFNVAPSVDIEVDAGSDMFIRTGDPVSLQWLVSNTEVIDASNVDVFIDWSGGTLVFDTIDIKTRGSNCAVTSATSRTCSYASLVAGANETIDVDFTTSILGTHVIALDSQVTEHDNDSSDNSDSLVIDVFERLVDLQPAIVNPPGTLTVGTPATLSFTGANNGPDEAQDPVFTADLGPAFTIQSTDSTDANCSVQNNTAVCTIPVLAAGQVISFGLTGIPNTAVGLPLRVTATTSDGDLVTGNNIAALAIAVVNPPPPPTGGSGGGGGGGGGSTSLIALLLLALATIRTRSQQWSFRIEPCQKNTK